MGIKLPFPLVRRAGVDGEELDPAAVQANFDKVALEAGVVPAKPTYETSLPVSPFEEQEIYYAASAGSSIIWHLRYRGAARSGAGAWEFLGGPWLVGGPGGNAAINTNSYTVYANVGVTVVAPLKGTYHVLANGNVYGTAGGGGIDTGIRVAADAGTGTATSYASTAGWVREYLGMSSLTFTVTAAGTTVRLQAFSVGAATFSAFSFSIQPVFVFA